jgi:hypothetical protein
MAKRPDGRKADLARRRCKRKEREMDNLYDLWSKHYREEVLRETSECHLLEQANANRRPHSRRIG